MRDDSGKAGRGRRAKAATAKVARGRTAKAATVKVARGRTAKAATPMVVLGHTTPEENDVVLYGNALWKVKQVGEIDGRVVLKLGPHLWADATACVLMPPGTNVPPTV